MNDENLISLADRTTKEKREIAIKGGKASGKARKEKSDVRKACQWILNMTLKSGNSKDIADIESLEDVKGSNITALQASLLKQQERALKGDKEALLFLLNFAGYNFQKMDKVEEEKRQEKRQRDLMREYQKQQEIQQQNNDTAMASVISALEERKIEGVDDGTNEADK